MKHWHKLKKELEGLKREHKGMKGKKGKKKRPSGGSGTRNRTRNGDDHLSTTTTTTTTPTRAVPPVLLIDCNNVRGTNDFGYTLGEFVSGVRHWTRVAGLQNRVFCHVDHGRAGDAHRFCCDGGGAGVVMVFPGTGRTSDDLICDDARYWMSKHDTKVAVVTNDNGLRRRLGRVAVPNGTTGGGGGGDGGGKQQRMAPSGRVKTFSSDRFLAMVERGFGPLSPLPPITNTTFPASLAALHAAEARLRSAQLSPLSPSSSSTTASSNEDRADADAADVGAVVAGGTPYREHTWERVLAAEVLRRCLARPFQTHPLEHASSPLATGSTSSPTPASVVDLDLAAHLRPPAPSASSSNASPTAGGGVSEEVLEAYLAARRRPLDTARALHWDHRIRHDTKQRRALANFARMELSSSQLGADCRGGVGGGGPSDDGGGGGDDDNDDDGEMPPSETQEGPGEQWIDAIVGLYS